MRNFLTYHLPLMLYSAAILTLSLQSDLRTPQVEFLAFDKVAHFVEYALFALLCHRSFTNLSDRIQLRQAFLMSLLFLSLFALVDETVQRFAPGRDPDLFDYLTDLLGGTCVLILLWLRQQRQNGEKA